MDCLIIIIQEKQKKLLLNTNNCLVDKINILNLGFRLLVSLSLCLSVCLPVCLSACLSVCLSIFLSVFLTVVKYLDYFQDFEALLGQVLAVVEKPFTG
jgi:hypothetical protein